MSLRPGFMLAPEKPGYSEGLSCVPLFLGQEPRPTLAYPSHRSNQNQSVLWMDKEGEPRDPEGN